MQSFVRRLPWPMMSVPAAPESRTEAPATQAERAPMSIEQELVQRALAGDGRAYQTLVAPHLAMLYRIAARACGGDRALAQDAVQEALTLAFERLDRYQPDTSLRALLAAMAVKQAHTLLRGERRRHAREEGSQTPTAPANPAELLGARRAAERIEAALLAMPKKRREVALLRLDAGLSYAEIASAVGTSEGSARVLVHHALAELRVQLADLTGAATPGSDR